MSSAVWGALTSAPTHMDAHTDHIPKSFMYISRTFKGLTPNGRYIHLIKNGRATYHPDYYTIDGRLLQPHT